MNEMFPNYYKNKFSDSSTCQNKQVLCSSYFEVGKAEAQSKAYETSIVQRRVRIIHNSSKCFKVPGKLLPYHFFDKK